MWLAVAVLLILGVFIGMGALRGGGASGLGLLLLLAAYGAAVSLGPVLGPGLAAQLEISELLAIPLAGSAAFVLTYLAMGIASTVVRRMRRPIWADTPTLRDRL